MKIIKLIGLLLALTILASALISCKGNKEASDSSEQTFADRDECTVTFNTNGGSTIDPITVYKNTRLAEMAPPTRDDYIFTGWTNAGKEWDFGESGDLVKTDMTLYANWAKLNTIFKCEEQDGRIVLTELINHEDYQSLAIPSVFNGMPVTAIGDEVFKNLTVNTEDSLFKGLKSLSFPASVTSIGYAAFESCTNLTLSFAGEISSLGENAFYNCNSIKQIKLSDDIKTIPFRAFSDCSLESIIIPDSVKLIDENAFELSLYLQIAVIPADVKIEDSAFRDCLSFRTVFFRGTEAQFGALEINGNNDPFKAAKVYYYSEQSDVESGKFWQYSESGAPTIIMPKQ